MSLPRRARRRGWPERASSSGRATARLVCGVYQRGDRAQTMRIGIDARQLCGRQTGVGRYLSGLLHEWATSRESRATNHEFVLYLPEAADSTAGLRRPAIHDAARARLRRNVLGTNPAAACGGRRSPGRLLRAAVFSPACVEDAHRRRHPRCVLRRPPRVVSHARGRPAAVAVAAIGRERTDGDHHLGVFPPRNRRAPRGA